MPELVAQVSLGATQRASFVGEPSPGSFAARPKQQERIFIIHGHDEGARNEVAAFLAQLGLRPVVLRDLPNKGRTIIEKVGDYANVGFAIAILTPDDVGKKADDHQGALQSRARQNVIFEMGFFIGVLGRAKVCALVKGNLEAPSDYHGVLFHQLDGGGDWKFSLMSELRSAGLELSSDT